MRDGWLSYYPRVVDHNQSISELQWKLERRENKMLISEVEKRELEQLVEQMRKLGIRKLERQGFCIELQETNWKPGDSKDHWVSK